jgi:hypothetical protein
MRSDQRVSAQKRGPGTVEKGLREVIDHHWTVQNHPEIWLMGGHGYLQIASVFMILYDFHAGHWLVSFIKSMNSSHFHWLLDTLR